jgi:hypothetical protein
MPEIYTLLKEHYDEECLALFKKSAIVNLSLLLQGRRNYDFSDSGDVFNVVYEHRVRLRKILARFDRLIFYGAGTFVPGLLDVFHMLDLRLPDEIWDINVLKQRRDFFWGGGG